MNNAPRIRIHVRHLDPLTEAGLLAALDTFDDFDVFDRSAAEEPGPADVLSMDYAGAMEYLVNTLHDGKRARVLVVTTNDRESDVRRALKQGARGYVQQGCSLAELASAARDVHRGNVHLCPHVASRLAESFFGDSLTRREEEVLRHVVEGLCNKEVARRLDMSVGTVKSHLRAVYAKLEVKSRTHAAIVASRRGIVHVPAPAGGADFLKPPMSANSI